MPDCIFNFEFGGSAGQLLPGIKRDIASQGGWVQGNASSGTAMVPSPAGDVEFSYHIAGQHLVIEVTDKPFVVSCDRIEAELRKVIPKPDQGNSNYQAPQPQPVLVQQPVQLDQSTRVPQPNQVLDFSDEPLQVSGSSGASTWPVALVLGLAAGVATWSLLKGKFS